MKKHIFDYFKTKDVYADYRKCGYSKKFLEEHRQEILLHKAAKNAFDELHLKKLPKVKDLSAEYAEILAEKKKLCRRSKEQNTILTSSLKAMKSRRRNVSENTISLDNSFWGICRFKIYGFPSFFISEENSNVRK